MDTDVSQIPAREPTKRAAAKKKTMTVLSDDSDSDNDVDANDDSEVEMVETKKKGGRKPVANAKAAAKPPAAAAGMKKRGPAGKQSQVLSQKLLTDMLKPAENSGISPEKKVRKMRASPFNKKSGSVLGRVNMENETTTSEEIMEVPTRARPQRANRRQTKYVISDSETENDADFDSVQESDDDDFSEDEE